MPASSAFCVALGTPPVWELEVAVPELEFAVPVRLLWVPEVVGVAPERVDGTPEPVADGVGGTEPPAPSRSAPAVMVTGMIYEL
jgi:hypothetical protein